MENKPHGRKLERDGVFFLFSQWHLSWILFVARLVCASTIMVTVRIMSQCRTSHLEKVDHWRPETPRKSSTPDGFSKTTHLVKYGTFLFAPNLWFDATDLNEIGSSACLLRQFWFQVFDSNEKAEKLFRFKLGKGKIIKVSDQVIFIRKGVWCTESSFALSVHRLLTPAQLFFLGLGRRYVGHEERRKTRDHCAGKTWIWRQGIKPENPAWSHSHISRGNCQGKNSSEVDKL